MLALALASTALGFGPLPDSAALKPGQPAPAWRDLIGTDGKTHALDDFKDKPAVLVVFFAVNCPDSLEYEDRLLSLARDYAPKGVATVFINVSLLPEDSPAKMAAHAKARAYAFPFLFDPTQKIGVAYAARVTPTVFVLDRDRKVAYRGAVDDDFTSSRVTRRYAREALDAVLVGKPVAEPETEAFGCDIDYEMPGPE